MKAVQTRAARMLVLTRRRTLRPGRRVAAVVDVDVDVVEGEDSRLVGRAG